MRRRLIDPRPLLEHDFGPYHPFKIYRLGLTYELMEAYELLDAPDVDVILPRLATEPEAIGFHTREYLDTLRLAGEGATAPFSFQHGLGTPDNPSFPGVYDWAMSVAGGSIQCAEALLTGETDRAFNFSGGLHHAMPNFASGFCHVNDGVLAIQTLLNAGKRVAYVDIDAHHGDGVEHAFYDTDRVLTVSIHQTGRTIFPGTGFVDDLGENEGQGYALNIPLHPGAGDAAYAQALERVILPALRAYKPDVLVTQLGSDAVLGDVVANLRMSLHQFERHLLAFRELGFPWLALGGGGYDVGNVVRAWTLAWATMLDRTLDDAIPSTWMASAAAYDVAVSRLRGSVDETPTSDQVLEDLDRTISALSDTVLKTLGC